MNTRQTTQDLANSASESIENFTQAASNAVGNAQHAADRAISKVHDQAMDFTGKAPGIVEHAMDRIKTFGQQSSDMARDTAAAAKDKAVKLADQTSDRIRQDPLKSVLIALAAGAALAAAASYVSQRRKSDR